jgi:sigma-E factor negative regulatory protein RseA
MKTTPSHDPKAVVRDRLSALADGELQGEEINQVLAACEQDSALLASWHDYHLIGDVLRSPDLLASRSAAPFLTRLQGRLAQEAIEPVAPTAAALLAPVAANDAIFRWQMLAGMASVAAVGVMVWMLAVPTSSTGSQLAQSPASADAVLVASPQGVIVRDARLDDFLAAHKRVGGNSALQMPSGFLRNATFENSPHAGR